MTTPLGYLMVAKKIGDNAPVGAVFHHRRWTGEILQPNVPGRDPDVTLAVFGVHFDVARARRRLCLGGGLLVLEALNSER